MSLRSFIVAPLPVAAAVHVWDNHRARRVENARLPEALAVTADAGLPALIGTAQEQRIGTINRSVVVKRVDAHIARMYPVSQVAQARVHQEVRTLRNAMLAPLTGVTSARWWCNVTDALAEDLLLNRPASEVTAIDEYAATLQDVIVERLAAPEPPSQHQRQAGPEEARSLMPDALSHAAQRRSTELQPLAAVPVTVFASERDGVVHVVGRCGWSLPGHVPQSQLLRITSERWLQMLDGDVQPTGTSICEICLNNE